MTSFPKWIWMNNSFNHVILYHFVLVWLHVWQTITDCIGVFHVHFICMIGVMAYLSAPMVPIGHHDCRQVNYALQSVTSTFQSFFYEEKEVFGHRNRHGEMGGWIFIPENKMGIDCWGCLRFHEPYQVTIKPTGNGWKWCWYLGIQVPIFSLKEPLHPAVQDKSQLKQEWKEHHFALHVYRKFFGCMTCYILKMNRFWFGYRCIAGWWFQILLILTPTWGNDLIWLILLKWVGATTN